MSRIRRKSFTPEQKAGIVREHLIDKVEVSVLCEQHSIQPSLFYSWRNQLFTNAALALQDGRRGSPQKRALDAERRKVEELKAQLTRKNGVIAELAERNVTLEKGPGGR